jgi:hypothetical protein
VDEGGCEAAFFVGGTDLSRICDGKNPLRNAALHAFPGTGCRRVATLRAPSHCLVVALEMASDLRQVTALGNDSLVKCRSM